MPTFAGGATRPPACIGARGVAPPRHAPLRARDERSPAINEARVAALDIYAVKGCRGLALAEAPVAIAGRRTMLLARASFIMKALLQGRAHDRLIRTVAFRNPDGRPGAHLVANDHLRRVTMIDCDRVEKPPQRLRARGTRPGRVR